jgi:hypothetical protein
LVNWRPVLLFQKDLRSIRLIQKSDNVDSIDWGVCWSCLRLVRSLQFDIYINSKFVPGAQRTPSLSRLR